MDKQEAMSANIGRTWQALAGGIGNREIVTRRVQLVGDWPGSGGLYYLVEIVGRPFGVRLRFEDLEAEIARDAATVAAHLSAQNNA